MEPPAYAHDRSDIAQSTTSPEFLVVSDAGSPRPSWFRSRNAPNEHGQAVPSAGSYSPVNADFDMPKALTAHEAPVSTPQALARWKIHWRSPALMAYLFLAGVACAIGHHFHYASLDGTAVDTEVSQQWAIRIGTGLAFLAKTCLTASVGVAYTQRLWVTVKKKPISLGNLDNVFSLTTDPLSFLSFEVLFSAKMLCLLAASMWCIPIVATITPATLSVRSGLSTNITSGKVPFLDFASDVEYGTWANLEGVGRVDSSSAAINRLMAATASSISTLPFDAPYPNSSYTLDFYGPAIKCENLSTAALDTAIDLGKASSLQEAWDKTMNASVTNSVSPLANPWFYTASTNSSTLHMYSHLFVNTGGPSGQNYSCHMWNTSYSVLFEFKDGVESSSIRALDYISPKNIQAQGIPAFAGAVDPDYAPGEVAYWSMFDALSRLVAVQLGVGSTGSMLNADSDIFKTGIVACPEIADDDMVKYTSLAKLVSPWMCRRGSVVGAIEDLSHNLTLSLLSSGIFANETAADVVVTRPQNYYSYNWHNLIIAYLTAAVVALVCVAVGAHAYVVNGYSASSSFSSIMFTTRNADLDRLAGGQCLGAQPIPRELGDVKLQYGLLQSEKEPAHAAFGLRGAVTKLRKGDPCF